MSVIFRRIGGKIIPMKFNKVGAILKSADAPAVTKTLTMPRPGRKFFQSLDANPYEPRKKRLIGSKKL